MQLNDWLVITLSVLTIALTVLGVLIAVIAIWGYRGIKDEAGKIAELHTKKCVAGYLDSASIQEKLKEMVEQRVNEEASRVYADLQISLSFEQREGVTTRPIGEEYPRDGADDQNIE